jgi:hypothetical protein
MSHKQLRILTPKAELRVSGEANASRIEGYAAKYNVPSVPIWDMFIEQLAPGCFDEVLADASLDCRFLHNHNPDTVYGRTTNGTLRLRSDNVGLYVECDLPDTQAARDLAACVKRGDITQMSFAFDIAPNGCQWIYDDTLEYPLRIVTQVEKLYDCCTATYPAYEQTTAMARAEGKKEIDDVAVIINALTRDAFPLCDDTRASVERSIVKLQNLLTAKPESGKRGASDVRALLEELRAAR